VAPLAPLALAASAGVAADRFGDPMGTLTWAGLALAGVGLAAVGWRWRWACAWAIAASFGALAGGWHHYWWSDLAGDDPARAAWAQGERRPSWVRGVVFEGAAFRAGDDGPRDRGMTRFVLALTGRNDGRGWRAASGRVQVGVVGDRSDLEPGWCVEAAGAMAAVEGPLNPGELDYRPILRARQVRLRLIVDEPTGVWDDPGGDPWPWTARLGAIRAWSRRKLESGLDPGVAPLASALLLGRREAVAPEVNDAFSRTGTTHLLAISGLHLQVLAVALGALARWLGLARRPAFGAVALGTVSYALLVGWAPSVVRSAAMTVGACLAGGRHRCTSAANLLAGAALATLLWDPTDLFDVGCQLSFLAVAAIVWLVPAVLAWDAPKLTKLDVLERRFEPRWRMYRRMGLAYAREGLIASAVVWLAAWPLVALRFHLVSPIGILINLPLIPLTSLALLLAGLALALAAAWAPLAWPFAWACGLCLGGTERVVRWGTDLPWGHRFVPGPAWAWTLGFYALLTVAMIAGGLRRPSRRAWWALALAWGAVGAMAPLVPTRPVATEAEVLAVGHGLAVVVRSPEGRTLLYDCGKMGDPRVGRRAIATALWSLGVRRLDVVVLSHADSDHYDGLPDLLDRFEVGAVRHPPGFEGAANPGARALLDLARGRGIATATIARGDRIDLGGGTTLTAWHPAGDGRLDSTDNARSVVLEVASGGRSLLLTGDLEGPGLGELAALPAPSGGFDAMLAPHHGGRTSNPASLYDWARPRLVIVSQRPPPNPGRDPLALLADRGRFPLLRTWQSGAVRFAWTPPGLVATGFLDAPRPAGRSGSRVAPASLLATGWPAWAWTLAALAAGVALSLAVVVVDWGAWSLVVPGRRPPGGDAAEGPAGSAIALDTPDGLTLAGTWFPGEAAGGRTVVLLHGMAEGRDALLGRVPSLLDRGWNVATLDARASGQSQGRRVSFGGREADDLRLWLDLLTPLAGPGARFAAWGRSMGAATALRAAAADPRIAALVLEAPYHDLARALARFLRRLKVPGALAPLVLLRARWLAGVSLDRPRPIDLAPGVACPALILQGADDPIAPPADARRLAFAFPRAAFVLEIPGAGHANIVGIGGDALLDQVADFLEAAFRQGESGSIPT